MARIARISHIVAKFSKLQHMARQYERVRIDLNPDNPFQSLGIELRNELMAREFSLNLAFAEQVKVGTSDIDIEFTVQAFRHAAFIYLYRVWLNVGARNPMTLGHVQKCLSSIGKVSINSPLVSWHIWPLFTARCEAVDVVQRHFVRDRFQAMFSTRSFPSLKRILRDVEDVWTTKDIEHVTTGLDGIFKIDCIQVILKRQGREMDLA